VAGSRRAHDRKALLAAPDRKAYLVDHSRLPGPRANLELLEAAGDVLPRDEALALAALPPGEAPSGSALEFLPCCGLTAVGRLLAEGATDTPDLVGRLRTAAGDERWRVREAVAIALQRWGDADLPAMVAAIEPWAAGTRLEARAAVAAICEPRLLSMAASVCAAVRILDAATGLLAATPVPRGEPARVLRAALGYGWSVAVAADPALALPAFERWTLVDDPDIRRLVRQNLGKARFGKGAPDAQARLMAAVTGPVAGPVG
jgi:hypothetical protein